MPGLLSRIIAWFSEEPAPGAGRGMMVPNPDAALDLDAGGLGPEEVVFRQRLKAVLGPRKAAAAGCVQFVGLESLKERLGPRWNGVQARVHGMIEKLLRQNLTADDVFYGYGTETYVVVFARLNPIQAGLVCAKVMQELQRLLLGEPDLASIVVRTAAREASGDLVLKPERLADLLARMVAHVQQTAPLAPAGGAAETPEQPPSSGRSPAPQPSSQALLSQSPPSQSSLLQAPLSQAPFSQAPLSQAQAAAALAEVGRGQAVAAAAVAATKGGDDDPWAHLRPVLGPLEVVYRPVWDVRGQALSLYIASPRRQRVGGRHHVYGYDTLTPPAGGVASVGTANGLQEILDLDRETLRQAVDAYLELYDNRFRYYLALPVHFETLAGTGRRRAYLDLASHVPAHLRPFITYQLMGVPDGVPVGRLTELVSALRPMGRGVTICADVSSQAQATFAAAGVKGVNVSLGGSIPRGRLIQDLYLAGAEARRRGLHILVDGIDTPEMEQVAEEAGCTFMTGDLIGPWVDFPGHATRLSRSDVLDQAMPLDR
ncbi:EAL domain-containing protein [Nitrospirillum amazonense]|nr:EAL domain-containing protein [Nitrospirillum amazonense]